MVILLQRDVFKIPVRMAIPAIVSRGLVEYAAVYTEVQVFAVIKAEVQVKFWVLVLV